MLRQQLKFFAKDILYYGLGNMLYSLVQFISMPLVVKSLDKSMVADWNILLPTGVLLASLVTFGMDSATVRFLKDAQDDKERARIFSTGFFFELIFALVVTSSLVIFSSGAVHILNLNSGQKSSWIVLMFWLPGIIVSQYFQNWFKYTFRRTQFIRLITAQALVYLGGIVFLKITGNINLFNVMVVMLISQWLTALTGLFLCRHLFIFQFQRKLLAELLKYGLPFMILAFGFNFIMSMDRYILTGRISREDFATYTQTVRISAIVTMVVSSFNFAFGPFSLSLLGKPDSERTFSRFHSYYLIAMTFIGLSFIAFGKPVILIFAGADYLNGYNFLVFFVGGYILYGLYSFAQLGIIHSKKSYFNIYVLLAGVLTCGGLGLLLSPVYQGYGTAIAFLSANLVMVCLANFFSASYFQIKYHLSKDILLFTLFGALGYSFTRVSFSDNLYIDGLEKFVIVLVILPIVFYFVLTGQEKNYLRKLVFKG